MTIEEIEDKLPPLQSRVEHEAMKRRARQTHVLTAEILALLKEARHRPRSD